MLIPSSLGSTVSMGRDLSVWFGVVFWVAFGGGDAFWSKDGNGFGMVSDGVDCGVVLVSVRLGFPGKGAGIEGFWSCVGFPGVAWGWVKCVLSLPVVAVRSWVWVLITARTLCASSILARCAFSSGVRGGTCGAGLKGLIPNKGIPGSVVSG